MSGPLEKHMRLAWVVGAVVNFYRRALSQRYIIGFVFDFVNGMYDMYGMSMLRTSKISLCSQHGLTIHKYVWS